MEPHIGVVARTTFGQGALVGAILALLGGGQGFAAISFAILVGLVWLIIAALFNISGIDRKSGQHAFLWKQQRRPQWSVNGYGEV